MQQTELELIIVNAYTCDYWQYELLSINTVNNLYTVNLGTTYNIAVNSFLLLLIMQVFFYLDV